VEGSYGIHWFRRDLRVAGNPALRWSWQRHRGRVLGLFCFDATFLARPDFSPDRFAFFLETLRVLQQELQGLGGELLVLDGQPAATFPRVLAALRGGRWGAPQSVSFNRDYEPFARARDASVTTMLERDQGLLVHTERDHLLIEPHELLKPEPGAGAPFYQVYSPFARRWFAALRSDEVRRRVEAQREGLAYLQSLGRPGGRFEPLFRLRWDDVVDRGVGASGHGLVDQLAHFQRLNAPRVRVKLPAAGSLAALAQLEAFRPKVGQYKAERDLPGRERTSRLSIYLKNGSITAAQLFCALELATNEIPIDLRKGSGASAFARELVWREFYYHVLFHCPRVEHEAFLEHYRDLPWENREEHFEAWKEGRTGYPLVDAGMRQLDTTGWMHNRVRMVVASFLTKDLLVDWRWGERYFMERLLDGDLAPNNGGWQWAASTGCDPQPYFRIFNPTLQAQRFDPDGSYLRRHLPERARETEATLFLPRDPIVDHAQQKGRAIALLERGRASS
jgi:deoxyribodipyrimidine photo-lyase